jgi:hypothetical protein
MAVFEAAHPISTQQSCPAGVFRVAFATRL